jgi:GDP-D-mannose 3',5'-epimerase
MSRVLVTGAGGFIGHHLVRRLKAEGHWVRGVDIKPPEFDVQRADEFHLSDLRRWDNCLAAAREMDEVYALAAVAEDSDPPVARAADVLHANGLIDLHMLEAARLAGVRRYLYASGACVYEGAGAGEGDHAFTEDDAQAARPTSAVGWAKLAGERVCLQYHSDYGIQTRIARLHEVYGPLSPHKGRRASAIVTLSRLAAGATPGGKLLATAGDLAPTSPCYVDDCVEGLLVVMQSDRPEPFNLTGDRASREEVVAAIVSAAGGSISLDDGRGVPPRSGLAVSTDRARRLLGWQPHTHVVEGVATTFGWVAQQTRNHRRVLERAEASGTEHTAYVGHRGSTDTSAT